MAAVPEIFEGRIAGAFELADGNGLDIDTEVTLQAKVIVKEVTLKSTRDGSLCMFFVCKPTGVRILRGGEADPVRLLPVDAEGTIVMPEDCPDPSYHDTFRYCPNCSWTENYVAENEFSTGQPGPIQPVSDELPAGPPTGVRISDVQPRSNVSGSSQGDRDSVLAAFLDAPAGPGDIQ